MSFKIRNGKPEDMQAVLNLITELAVFEKEPNAVDVTVEDLRKYGFSDNPKFKTFIAEEPNGDIIGMALFYERFSTWKGKSIHLEDLMITQSKRGIGAGKALYDSVLKYAHNNNYKRVEWVVLDWNTNAIEFYKKSGATILKNWYVAQMSKENLEKYVNENI